MANGVPPRLGQSRVQGVDALASLADEYARIALVQALMGVPEPRSHVCKAAPLGLCEPCLDLIEALAAFLQAPPRVLGMQASLELTAALLVAVEPARHELA